MSSFQSDSPSFHSALSPVMCCVRPSPFSFFFPLPEWAGWTVFSVHPSTGTAPVSSLPEDLIALFPLLTTPRNLLVRELWEPSFPFFLFPRIAPGLISLSVSFCAWQADAHFSRISRAFVRLLFPPPPPTWGAEVSEFFPVPPTRRPAVVSRPVS